MKKYLYFFVDNDNEENLKNLIWDEQKKKEKKGKFNDDNNFFDIDQYKVLQYWFIRHKGKIFQSSLLKIDFIKLVSAKTMGSKSKFK